MENILFLALRRSFWYGFAFSTGVHMFVQDWHGQEGYIEFVRTHWVDLHWGVGLLIAALGFTLHQAMLGRFHWLAESKEKENG